ncbi:MULTISPECIES: TetR/AcrR family transcriptional regulator [Bacillus cereus group]|uniref:TetR/AcrR family transcriptional regulator n=1 Tax=Bacillus cereus group TaxID=86661 RepID=UPI002AC03C47|nr:TetR/AcrR family transcriptional regulator [Bacillus cereus]MDA2563389.1 TetR/AcrR family transcriptional regulator [Bacillus cereus]MDA2568593.1 TetR/AcrR family transcriptional regulator [Bacillus cereus]MDZ4479800.1 TetR/AcrR family transcriptional regulator [Bacillus cereus]MDZ4496040.1 TetR/AcrR family transcriptional regulator [Bacillus cereus]MDZ4578416.1 TetR/AcrR family transcriptional regulator [Bacillus cereus]
MTKISAKERILEAAISLFGEKGYSSTTTREIAEKAKVSEVTIFRHFGNKEKLFKEGIILKTTPVAILADLTTKLTGDVEHDLNLLGNIYMEINIPKVSQIWAVLIEARQNEEMKGLFNEINMRLINHLVTYLNKLHGKGEIPLKDFKLISAMFYGQLFTYLINMVAIGNDEMNNVTSEHFVATCASMYNNYLKESK